MNQLKEAGLGEAGVQMLEEDVLYACLPAVTAHRMLQDPEVMGELTSEDVYNLALQAGFDKEAAEQAARQQANARLDRGLPT